MPKRYGMNRRKSKRVFSHGAQRVHPKNTISRPMRGGIRL